ncbi:rna-directed dna polymerase from mobile element jockey-like [Willisornis vidua]|uniref:Rna-directed dna polymerase from mobile element jockey-like n=1 Tax=Willisornis vidua TaxID=1566151 RepID=A0ABQ9CZH5_9PASS|nr:rna-directed dna polymerase from mobile element jockey-like [Willisornis vidua]
MCLKGPARHPMDSAMRPGHCNSKGGCSPDPEVVVVVVEAPVLVPVLFNIFVVDVDGGTECTFRKFAKNNKSCGTVNTPEGKNAVQRDLDTLERWTCANSMKFNKTKCKVLHLGQDNPKYKTRMDKEGFGDVG